ncbi:MULTISPECIES: MlaC/ttg2D family ABC transporter substrate-binding protein [Tepidiphilus]|jgi:phospholipid transport system substrate-binding protein|uniref:ABC-type transporter Mla maintaining outer membrane lipid asymmetry, periplasmic MlaC component n=1 Tax=Tepidiphilus thermophilus TaxID=876478 RepID=A0A0K6IPH5_9PROT|nr:MULTISPECIES: ABC transporter substrate-binding protein [Tepidiphilus]CUB04994.1 ABC-type transporter Mla maintaining outer membrane lipid asymmetry, periplasmic MlaC component [Tepidiphilus thermophilus]
MKQTMMRRWLAACLALLAMTWGAALRAEPKAPDVLVKEISDEVIERLKQRPIKTDADMNEWLAYVEQRVLPHFDFERMTMLAVGQPWRQATPEQRKRLTQEFKTLLVRTYANALREYRDEKLEFKPLRMAPGDKTVRVSSMVIRPGSEPIAIDYVMELKGDGWKVFDVVVAGVSLVTSYRSTFGQEIQAKGIDGLIQTLAEKNAHGETMPADTAKQG